MSIFICHKLLFLLYNKKIIEFSFEVFQNTLHYKTLVEIQLNKNIKFLMLNNDRKKKSL